MTLQQEYALLSDSYRNFVATLGDYARNQLEKTLTGVFGGAALRNVQLWGTQNATRRNIINSQTPVLERDLRIQFVRLLTSSTPTTQPTKTSILDGPIPVARERLKNWLANPFVVGEDNKGGNLQNIALSADGVLVMTLIDDSPTWDNLDPLDPDDPIFDGILE